MMLMDYDQDDVNSLCAAVARLMADAGLDAVQLGPGGRLVEVDESGQVHLDGIAIGEPDTGHNVAGALKLEIE